MLGANMSPSMQISNKNYSQNLEVKNHKNKPGKIITSGCKQNKD